MKIAVLVSGGVDSAVALNLLKEEGHDLTAFYLKIWLEDELSFLGECPWEEDLAMVRAVCEQAGVPLEVISLQKEYWDRVVTYTIDEVKAGRTPNPDIMCNQRIKFGAFYDKIDDSYEKVATGHYAQVENGVLKISPDEIKDQTYFLAQLSPAQLQRALFPLGKYPKEKVRELAHQFDLPNKDRKDSQGICFLGKIEFSEFIRHHLGTQSGDLINVDTGEKMGEHDGYWYYTIGQRKGIGLGNGPWFVVRKDIPSNTIYISNEYHAEDKSRDKVKVTQFNWLSGYEPPIRETVPLKVKLRHGPQVYDAQVEFHDDDSATIHLPESDQGIAAGQFAVFYKEGVCLGSGVMG